MSRKYFGIFTALLTGCLCLCVILLSAVEAFGAPYGFDGDDAAESVVLILANGFDICDAMKWTGQSHISDSATEKLIYEGSLGSMNTKTASSGPEFCELDSACATLGAATRMRASKDDCVFLSARREHEVEETGEVFERRTGFSFSLLPEEVMVCTGVDKLIRHNLASGYSGKPGFLGESLKRAGVPSRVINASDRSDLQASLACLLAMDETGKVIIASNTDVWTSEDYDFEKGTSTETVEKKDGESAHLNDFKGLTVVGFTDILTAVEDEAHMSKEISKKSLDDAYARLDALLTSLFSVFGEPSSTTVYILVSSTSIYQLTGVGNELASLLIIGGGFERGLLKSATTRQEGVVANVDLAPTVTTLLGAPQAWRVQGRPMYCVNTDKSTFILEKNVHLLNFSWKTRVVFLGTLIAISVLGVMLSFILLLVFTGRSGREIGMAVKAPIGILKTASAFQIYCASMPLSALIVPFVMYAYEAFSEPGRMAFDGLLSWTLFFMLVTGALISYFAFRFTGSALKSVSAIALATVVVICMDCALGGQLAQLSPLSYSAISGARYYGVGNEFMGVLLGCLCLLPYALNRVWGAKTWDNVHLLAMELLAGGAFLGSSSLGANFGGMVTALTMAVFAEACWWLRSRQTADCHSSRPYSRRSIISLLAGTALLVTTVILIDSTASEPSHIGRLLGSSFEGRLGEVVNLVYRKVRMNLSLMNVGVWTKILFVSVFAMSAVTFGRMKFLKLIGHDEKLYIALLTAAMGCIVAFFLNDSGIVACMTAMILPLFFSISYLFSSQFEQA